MRAVIQFGLAGYCLGVHLPVLVDPDLSIEPAYAVKAHLAGRSGTEGGWTGAQLPVGVDEPHAVIFANLPIDAEHANVGVVAEQRIGCNNAFSRRAIIRQKSADRPRPHLAGEAHSIKWIDNPASEDQVERSLKIIGI